MKKRTIILILLLNALMSCDYADNRLIINNKSKSDIYIDVSEDTILRQSSSITFKKYGYFIKSNTKKNIILHGSKRAWEQLINNSVDKKLHIFICSKDTLNTYNISQIIEMKNYETINNVGVEELKANNWEVVYE